MNRRVNRRKDENKQAEQVSFLGNELTSIRKNASVRPIPPLYDLIQLLRNNNYLTIRACTRKLSLVQPSTQLLLIFLIGD